MPTYAGAVVGVDGTGITTPSPVATAGAAARVASSATRANDGAQGEDIDMDRPRPEDAIGFLTAWAAAQQRWSDTVERARGLPEEQLNQNVDGEWSFVQTLRHLLFVTDSWVSRGMLGVPAPHHPLGLPPTGMKAVRDLDLDARPSLAEVLALRAERTRLVERVMTLLTDAELDEERRVSGPGHPRAGVWPVRRCATAVVSEEWRHRDYAERDLGDSWLAT